MIMITDLPVPKLFNIFYLSGIELVQDVRHVMTQYAIKDCFSIKDLFEN